MVGNNVVEVLTHRIRAIILKNYLMLNKDIMINDRILRKNERIMISSCYRTVPSAIWEIFSKFLVFCNLFHEPLGE